MCSVSGRFPFDFEPNGILFGKEGRNGKGGEIEGKGEESDGKRGERDGEGVSGMDEDEFLHGDV